MILYYVCDVSVLNEDAMLELLRLLDSVSPSSLVAVQTLHLLICDHAARYAVISVSLINVLYFPLFLFFDMIF